MANLETEAARSFVRGMVQAEVAGAAGYRSDQASLLRNVRPLAAGVARVRGGTRRAHAAQLAVPIPATQPGAFCYGAIEFVNDFGNRVWITILQDIALASFDEGATWSQVGATLRKDAWSFAVVERGSFPTLIAANGGTTYLYEGFTTSSFTALTGIPTNVRYLASFNGRLWAAGHDGNTLVASAIGNGAEWNTTNGALSLQVPGGGNIIRGLVSTADVLLVFKDDATAYVDGFGNSDLVVAAGSRGVSGSVGCRSFRTVVTVGDQGAMWLSDRGVEWYRPGRGIELISAPVEQAIQGIVTSHPPFLDGPPAGAIFYPAENEYWIYGHTGESSLPYQHDVYVYRLDTGAWFRVLLGDVAGKGTTAGVLFTADRDDRRSAPVAVDSHQRWVRRVEFGTRDDVAVDGTGGLTIDAEVRTRPFLFGDSYRRKRARIAYARVEADADATVTLQVATDDGAARAAHTLTVRAGKRRTVRARVSERGVEHTARLLMPGGLTVHEIGIRAEVLRGPA